MLLVQSIFLLITYGVTAIIVITILLMLLRLLLGYMDVNPFSWFALTVRRLTDPLVNPVRGGLIGFGIEPKFAPFVTILLVILVGYFTVQIASSVLNTIAGVVFALNSGQGGALIAVAGYLLYGLLAFYSLLILIRIVFSWGMVGYGNRVMRFLLNATDPLLIPLRRMIPPVGMFDISPIVAFIILWLFQAAIAGTLLRGWPLRFFG